MRKALVLAGLAIVAAPLSAQTVDSILSKYVQTIGGAARIQAVQTLRRTGRFTGGGGFEAVVVQENKRPNRVRQEFSLQGMTGINAYDGTSGWKIEPWQGKKDPEALSEEEMRDILEESDFDGPVINYQQKGNRIEFVGMEQFEGTDAFKLKVTLANGDVRYFYLDTDYYVPIRIETKRMIRGAEQEFETSLGDYKEVAGGGLPPPLETGPRGRGNKTKNPLDKSQNNATGEETRVPHPGPAPRRRR